MEDWHSFGKSYVMTLRAWLDLVKDWEVGSLSGLWDLVRVASVCWISLPRIGIDHVFTCFLLFLNIAVLSKSLVEKEVRLLLGQYVVLLLRKNRVC